MPRSYLRLYNDIVHTLRSWWPRLRSNAKAATPLALHHCLHKERFQASASAAIGLRLLEVTEHRQLDPCGCETDIVRVTWLTNEDDIVQ